MRLSEEMHVPHGITAAVGGGGKTTLLWRLARELSESARVILCTTTHIWPPACETLLDATREQIRAAKTNLLCVASRCENGKLGPASLPPIVCAELADYVLAEADGSRGLPLKAPAEHEPAIPDGAALVLAVAGMQGLRLPIARVAHRPERYAAITGATLETTVTPEHIAAVLQSPYGQRKMVSCRFAAVLNAADTPQRLEGARACAARISGEAFVTALQTKPDFLERWRNGQCW